MINLSGEGLGKHNQSQQKGLISWSHSDQMHACTMIEVKKGENYLEKILIKRRS